MAVSSCFTDFKSALADIDGLTSEEKNDLLKDVQDRAQARLEKRLEPKAQALNKSIEEMLEERDADQKLSRKQSLLAMKKRILADQQIDQFPNKSRGLFAYVGGVESNLPNSRFSVTAKLLFDRQTSFAKFLKPIEDEQLLDTFNNKKNDVELGRAIWNKQHDDPKINKIAKSFLDYEEWSRNNLNAEGAAIGKADDRITSMVHNSHKMKSATGSGLSDSSLRGKLLVKNNGDYVAVRKDFAETAYKRWKGEIEPLLNNEKTFEKVPEDQRDKFLRGTYEGLVTGIHKVPYNEVGSPLLTRTGSNIGKKLGQPRVLFFKDADSWIKYNTKFGNGTIHDSILNEIEQSAKNWTVMKNWGTSPRPFMERIIKDVSEKTRDIGTDRQNKKFIRDSRNLVDTILGNQDNVEDGLAGKIINSLRTYTYMTKMGNITPASIPDLNIMISACRQHNIPAVEVMKEAFGNLTKGLPKGEKIQVALDTGTYSKGTIGGIMSKFGNVDTPNYMFAKGMQLVDKVTFINRWDSANRVTMGTLLSRRMATTLGQEFDKIPESQRRTLTVSGVDKNVWELLQKNKSNLPIIDRQKYLTPEIVKDIPDEDMKAYSKAVNPNRKKFTAQYLDGLRNDVKERLGVFFTDQSAYGKVFPNASDHALMNFGVKTNTLPGRLWQLMTMFKSFHVASLRRTYGRFLFGNGAESLYDAIFHGKADFSGMINYMVGGMPWNYLSMASESLARGMTPPSLDDRKTWSELFQRSVIPLYGSIMQLAQSDNTLSGLSPVFGTIKDTKQLLSSLAQGKNVKNQATWLAQNNIPIIKTFYTQLALNRGVWDKLHSSVDPSYSTKLQMKAAQNNQSYYWAPSS